MASISDVFVAESATSPVVVSTSLESIHASALLWTTFVAMVALTASDAPLPFQELPPDEVALESAVAMIVAFSIAETTMRTGGERDVLEVAVDGASHVVEDDDPTDRSRVGRRHVEPCGISVVTATGCQ